MYLFLLLQISNFLSAFSVKLFLQSRLWSCLDCRIICKISTGTRSSSIWIFEALKDQHDMSAIVATIFKKSNTHKEKRLIASNNFPIDGSMWQTSRYWRGLADVSF